MRFTGGLPETACGWGSTLRATERLRAELPGLLATLGTRVLLDAPCGDLNWISRVELLPSLQYIGADASETNIETAKHNWPSADVRKLNLLTDPLPEADTVLCRDFLQHLPTNLAIHTICRFVANGALWLLATSHDVVVNRDIDDVGDFRPLNLQAAPFDLGPPKAAIPDCDGRILGAWELC